MKLAFLVRGDDESLVRQRVAEVVHDALAGEDAGLAVTDFGEEAELADILDSLATPPFLTGRRIVVVRAAGRFGGKGQPMVDPLVDYLRDPLPTSVLVAAVGGGTVSSKLVKAVEKVGEVVDVGVPTSGKARLPWLRQRLAQAPVSLNGTAIDLVADRLGTEMGRLEGILASLAAAYGEGASLGPDEVEPFLGGAGGVPPWELTDKVDVGDAPGALAQVQRLVAGGSAHPLQLLAILQGHYGRMLRLDGAGAADKTAAAAILGGSPFPAAKALEQGRRLGSARVAKAIGLLHQADLDLKGAREWPAEVVLEVLVARLCQLSRAARRGA